jgi:hypothetical protein
MCRRYRPEETDMSSTTQLSDGIFIALLLAGSVLSVVTCLWLAQVISMKRCIFGRLFEGNEKLARTGLGVLALAGSIAMLTGLLPGNFLTPWTAFAACGTGLLGMFTIVSAQRGKAAAANLEDARSEFETETYKLAQPTQQQQPARKAA